MTRWSSCRWPRRTAPEDARRRDQRVPPGRVSYFINPQVKVARRILKRYMVTRRKRCNAGIMRTDMARRDGSRPAEPNTPHEGAGSHRDSGRRERGWWRRVRRRLMSPPSAELILAQLNGQLAVLEGARAELEVGWVQGGWWSVTSADGDPSWSPATRAAARLTSTGPAWSAPWRGPGRLGRRPGGRRRVRRAVGLP